MNNQTAAYTAEHISIEYDYLMLLYFLKSIANKRANTGKTCTYSNGNITECSEYAYTTGELGEPLSTKTWSYNDSTWSDLLTNYNGTAITYDEIGNPLTMGSKELTWLGRQLQSITDGEDEIAYTYNGDGLRTSKTVNGTTTEYYYNGSILAGQKSGNDTLVFMYDNNSDIFGFVYNGTEYYYIKNAQNDVIAIADADGNVLVKYEYDAWGKISKITKADGSDITDLQDDIFHHTADFITGEQHPVLDENGNPVTSASTEVTLARINPILYRSYYYDRETGWYYLNTRYYSPDMCRFINADGIVGANKDILSFNLFAYCSNDPINHSDSNGQGKIRNWIRNGLNKIKNYINKTFGFSLTFSNTKNKKKTITKNKLISIKTGIKSSRIYNKGESKPVTAYVNCELSNVFLSTFGIKINISKLTIEYSYGFDNFGRTIAWNEDDFTYSNTRKIDASEMAIVNRYSVTKNWDCGNISVYDEASIYIEPIAKAFAIAYAYNNYSAVQNQPYPKTQYPRTLFPSPRLSPAYIYSIIVEVKL